MRSIMALEKKEFDQEEKIPSSSRDLEEEEEEEEEKAVVRALDRRMLPLFCVFYFTDYLDRANIGNAT